MKEYVIIWDRNIGGAIVVFDGDRTYHRLDVNTNAELSEFLRWAEEEHAKYLREQEYCDKFNEQGPEIRTNVFYRDKLLAYLERISMAARRQRDYFIKNKNKLDTAYERGRVDGFMVVKRHIEGLKFDSVCAEVHSWDGGE